MTLETKVHFLCSAPEHAQAGRDPAGGLITIEDGKWALCFWGKTELHLWESVEPMDVETARRTKFPVIEKAARNIRGIQPANARPASRPRVLVVDDDDDVAATVRGPSKAP